MLFSESMSQHYIKTAGFRKANPTDFVVQYNNNTSIIPVDKALIRAVSALRAASSTNGSPIRNTSFFIQLKNVVWYSCREPEPYTSAQTA